MTTVLIVDDASFMRGSLKFIIETAGYTVVGEAKEGKEAVEIYKKIKPDVVTLDILMDGMDGMTALANIKKLNPAAKVIMITALGQEEKQNEARALGANGYIRKPFKQDEIVKELKRVVGSK
ncbi:MAG: response regulator [Methanoregula sp.]|nr:response regulator [Methanoregula sp.]